MICKKSLGIIDTSWPIKGWNCYCGLNYYYKELRINYFIRKIILFLLYINMYLQKYLKYKNKYVTFQKNNRIQHGRGIKMPLLLHTPLIWVPPVQNITFVD